MELTTFGAAIKYAIRLETQAMNIYNDAAQAAKNKEYKSILFDLSASNKKRKAMLENLYNENVYSDQDTGIFEPIPGLEGDSYLTQSQQSNKVEFSKIISLGMEMEEKSKSFYLDLAAQLKSRRRGLAKKLEKTAQVNLERRLKLKSLQDNFPI